MRVDIIPVGQMQVNCYALSGKSGETAILIDPGDEAPKIKSFLKGCGLTAKLIVHTHGHIDHIAGDNEFDLPIYAHRLDAGLLKDPVRNLSDFLSFPFRVKGEVIPLEDGQEITLDDMSLRVIHTPGHTPGGICLASGKYLFTGDTLFAGSVGRTDFPGASSRQLIRSIRDKLFGFGDDTVIYPGHGPASTLGEEKANNPFLCRI